MSDDRNLKESNNGCSSLLWHHWRLYCQNYLGHYNGLCYFSYVLKRADVFLWHAFKFRVSFFFILFLAICSIQINLTILLPSCFTGIHVGFWFWMQFIWHMPFLFFFFWVGGWVGRGGWQALHITGG